MNDRRSLWGKILSLMIRVRMNVTNVYQEGTWSSVHPMGVDTLLGTFVVRSR